MATLAVLLLLGMFDAAGSVGAGLDDAVSYVFGWDKIFLPFFLLAWAYSTVAPDRLPIRWTNALGMLGFFITFNPLVHAVTFWDQMRVDESALRVAGGVLGQVLSEALSGALGMPGLLLVASALCVISILLIFNATLKQVLFAIDLAWKALRAMGRGFVMAVRPLLGARGTQEESVTAEPLRELTDEMPGDGQADGEEDTGGEEGDEAPGAEGVPIKPRKRYPKIEIPMELLEQRNQKPNSGDIVHNRDVIRRTLETFGIPVEMAEVSVGPTVTQFTLKPSDGVKLTKITGLHNDLALALAAHPIRIEAPIPGKSLVGIEVPNQSVATVGQREILESREFRDRKSNITFVLGKDVSGKPWVADLGRMPHLLVAGATGSGKSVALNTLIMSFLYSNGPDDVKFIMVDPKRVELQVYNGIPHLLTPVITRVPETVNALKWALCEMDRRYDLLSKFGSRDLAGYNARVQDKLPYLIIIIDELADLMASSASEVEGPIVRLAQMSRAVGIHLVLATQRPSVDVITGLIKANIPGRIAFAVASATDSRTILDQQGAEKLLGRGDMLLSTSDMATPKRLQGAFISEAEIGRVVEFIKSKYDPADYDFTIVERPSGGPTIFGGSGDDDDSDPLIPDAKEEILRAGKASASLLQRRLKVGYARAARLLDLLEQEGFIGPGEGAKPREILKADFTRQTDVPPRPTTLEDAVPVEETLDEDASEEQL